MSLGSSDTDVHYEHRLSTSEFDCDGNEADRIKDSLVREGNQLEWIIRRLAQSCKTNLAADLVAHIVEYAIEASSSLIFDDLCECPGASYEDRRNSKLVFRWTNKQRKTPNSDEAPCVTTCRCGRLLARYRERNCTKLNGTVLLRPFIVSAPAQWEFNRHFFVEGGGTRLVRHRGSHWHNFRSGVAREWVRSGIATYRLKLVEGLLDEAQEDEMETVVIPGARLAVGVIGRNVELNSVNDYVLGQHLGTVGLALAENHEHEISCISLLCGPDGRSSKSFPLRKKRVTEGGYKRFIGIEVEVTINYSKRDVKFAVDGQVIPINAQSCIPSGPLAVAVSLKYAHDTVEIIRAE